MKKLQLGTDGNKKEIYLSQKDRALSHMHVVGSTRTGKSKFLEGMIRGDIKNRQGLCLIDPHGRLYDDVLNWCAYHNLTNRDIILLNPSVGDSVLGFNPFQKSSGDVSVQVDAMITATIRAWGMETTDETPTLERWLRCIYQTLVEKGLTIIATEYLIDFFEEEMRRYLTDGLSKSLIKSEWRKLGEKTPKQFDDELTSTKNRLMRFLCSDQICRFMGMNALNINIQEIMDSGKILLINLAESGNLSKPNADLMGALLINEICQQARRRKQDEWGRPPKPFYVYIDEFQNYVSLDIATGLDELKKFGLGFILAHQRFCQVGGRDTDIFDAILTNAKIRAVFGGLPRNDTKMMVEEMFVNQLDLMEIKMAIYQTKFFPVYTRDKVYGTSKGVSRGRTTSSSLASGSAIQSTVGSWFTMPETVAEAISQTESQSETQGWAEQEMEIEASSEMDIPMLLPVPFQELSSAETWSLEEQIWRMSDALKGQFQRHCFIQMPTHKTRPMLVPFVKSYNVYPKALVEYQEKLYQQAGAITHNQADKILEAQKLKLIQDMQASLMQSAPQTAQAKAKIKKPKRPKFAKV